MPPGNRLAALLLLASFPPAIQARPMALRSLQQPASAPVLVTGRVTGIADIGPEPDESKKWRYEIRVMAAQVEVLRTYTASPTPVPARIQVRFLAFGPSVTAVTSGPMLPNIKTGSTFTFPLKQHDAADSGPWPLKTDIDEEVIPAREQMAPSFPAPASARAYIDREIANSLAFGTPREIDAVALYLREMNEDLTGEIMPLIEPAIGNNRDRWAEVGSTLLAEQGIPHPGAAEMLAKAGLSRFARARASLFLPAAALQKLGPSSPETDAMLIRVLIADAPLHAWGSANVLVDYNQNPLTTETLRQALRDDVAGSSYIAWTLARNGNRAILPEALARALRVADRPDASTGQGDLQGAGALLREFGSDQDLKQLAQLVRKYQTQNQNFYTGLWQYSTENGNPREARVLAVVLHDTRPITPEMRACDFALGVLERAVGQTFHSSGTTIQDRDAAVAKALAWLEAQGLTR